MLVFTGVVGCAFDELHRPTELSATGKPLDVAAMTSLRSIDRGCTFSTRDAKGIRAMSFTRQRLPFSLAKLNGETGAQRGNGREIVLSVFPGEAPDSVEMTCWVPKEMPVTDIVAMATQADWKQIYGQLRKRPSIPESELKRASTAEVEQLRYEFLDPHPGPIPTQRVSSDGSLSAMPTCTYTIVAAVRKGKRWPSEATRAAGGAKATMDVQVVSCACTFYEHPTETAGLYTYDYACKYLVQGGGTANSSILMMGYVGPPPSSSPQLDEGALCFYYGCYNNTAVSNDGQLSLDLAYSLFEQGGVTATVSATFSADLSDQSEAHSYEFVWTPIDDNDQSNTDNCPDDTSTCVVTDISSEGMMEAYVQTNHHGEVYDWVRLTRAYPSCGNAVVDTIMAEYREFSVQIKPDCGDFASSGGTAHFTWSELNGGFAGGSGHNPWGIAKASMKDGIEATRTNYNRGGIRLSSGYRCPHGNRRSDGVAQSRHMRGDAADMYSIDHTWTETEFSLLKAAADLTGPVESFTWDTYPKDRHYHAAWQ